jgi:hypothetical protein
MKKGIRSLLLILLFFISQQALTQAQTKELLAGNVLNGAITGTLLGAATIGLNNSDDLTPLRIGVGSGILGGAGIAAYDLITLPKGQQFYISGIFNDGRNSSVLILLDTFYGAAGGAVLGSAVMLISNQPIIDGLQYGSGVGAWAGFGLGLLDSFFIAERNRDFISSKLLQKNSLIDFQAHDVHFDLIQPDLVAYNEFTANDISLQIEPVLNIISFQKRF